MRDHTTPIFRELSAQGAQSVSLTPGATQQTATFSISGVPPVSGDMRNYAQNFYLHLLTTLDADGAGSAVSWDKLYKGLASARLFSPLLGECYPATHTRGATLGHIMQVLAARGGYPQPARAQIPTNTDADYTLDLFYCLPFSFEFLVKPHETAQWVGFFDQGLLEGSIDVSTAFDGDYAGAVTKAPTSMRAWVEMLPSPDIAIGVPFQFRERSVAGGGQQFILKGVGQETNLTGVEPGCGLAFLAWLAAPTGIGLSGADTVEKVTAVEIPWRSQQNVSNTDTYFLALRKLMGRRVGPVAGTGTTIVHDGSGWPSTMDSTPNNRPKDNTGNMFLPLIVPGQEFETSKAQRVVGDLPINFTFSATPSGNSRFLSLELMEFTEERVAVLAQAMGVDLSQMEAYRKAVRKNEPEGSKLRYTRITFKPKAAAA